MLTIKAEGNAGASLRDGMIPEMIALSQVTGCCVEVQANETTFWAYPDDTQEVLKAAYDRLYPASRLVASYISRPIPRKVK